MPRASITAYVDSYCLARTISVGRIEQLRITARMFSRWTAGEEGEVPVETLCDDVVNRWLVHLDSTPTSKRRVQSQRSNLLALWRAAYDDRLVEKLPGRIRKIKAPPLVPKAWTLEEVRRLLVVAALLEGKLRRSPLMRAEFFVAMIRTAWDTGLRLGDLLKIKRSTLNADGSLWLVQEKTGKVKRCQLDPDTVAALARVCVEGDDRLLPWPFKRKAFYRHWRRMVRQAGLVGGSKKVRKSAATAVEMAQPGGAMSFLGHCTPGLAAQFYIDPTLVQSSSPTPPRLT